MSIELARELVDQAERGNVLLFVGEQISRDQDGQSIYDRLRVELAQMCGLDAATVPTLAEVAQEYEAHHTRHTLLQFVSDRLRALGDAPLPIHRLIAQFTACQVLITTCLDARLERAFTEAGRLLDVFIKQSDSTFGEEHHAQLYRLRGRIDQLESLILTETDYERAFKEQESISVLLRAELVRKTILFVGCDLADPHFQELYLKITSNLDQFTRRSYVIFAHTPTRQVDIWCRTRNIEPLTADPSDFLTALIQHLTISSSHVLPPLGPQEAEEIDLAHPENPYKLLDYYTASDATSFFGRQQESQTLSAMIYAHRLVVLHGASGVGKTSLLLAGVLPRLERASPAYAMLYVRALDDPAQVIRRTLRRRWPEVSFPESGTLVECLDAVTRALGRPLVIVLDQFEEFFIRLSPQFRAAFVSELGTLYDSHDVPVKVLFSLREDWLASLSEFERRIPEVFRSKMRLEPLTRQQARQAIAAPVANLGITYEPDLLERLLDDLAGSSPAVLPPQLQLVCSALFANRAPDQRLVTLVAYEQLGTARGVLQRYLDNELARLEPHERGLARAILEELVTSQGTRATRTRDELVRALDTESNQLTVTLEKMTSSRLLRPLEGGGSYELAHEYLIRDIHLGPETQKRKQIEELVRQEVENWRRFGTFLQADRLALIQGAGAELRFSPLAQELVLRSALTHEHQLTYWLERISSPDVRRAAFTALFSREGLVKLRQRPDLLRLLDIPEAAEVLLELTGHDDPVVQSNARNLVTRLEAQIGHVVEHLERGAQAADVTVRRRSLVTLAGVPARRLDEPRIATLLLELGMNDADGEVQAVARKVLGRLTGQLPAIIGAVQARRGDPDREVRQRSLQTLAALPLGRLRIGLWPQVIWERVRTRNIAAAVSFTILLFSLVVLFILMDQQGLTLIGTAVRQTVLTSLQIIPFIFLAILAYIGRDRRWGKLATLFVLGGIILTSVLAIVVLSFVALIQVDPAPLTDTPILVEGGTEKIFSICVLIGFVILIGLLAFNPTIRKNVSRIIPIDPSSFVHTIALVTLTVLSLTNFIPQIILGEPPLMIITKSTSDLGFNLGSGPSNNSTLSNTLYGLIWLIPGAIFAVGYRIHRDLGLALRRVGLMKPTWRQVGIAIGVGLGLVVFMRGFIFSLDWLWNLLGWVKTDSKSLGILLGPTPTAFESLAIGISVAISEELVVRGVLQPRVGIALSNLFFTSLHAFQYRWDALLIIYVVGLICGLMRQRINTTSSIVTHLTYNVVIITFAGLQIPGFVPELE